MSGSRWVITPLWLSGSLRSFLYSSSVYSCYLFLISSASVLYCAHLCMKCFLGSSNFLEEISSLSHSIVFLYLFALFTEEGFLISPCYSLELWIHMGNIFPFLLCLLPLFFSQLFVKPSQTTILPFCISFSCHMLCILSAWGLRWETVILRGSYRSSRADIWTQIWPFLPRYPALQGCNENSNAKMLLLFSSDSLAWIWWVFSLTEKRSRERHFSSVRHVPVSGIVKPSPLK